jgi:CO/xanthine dehydrogenase FAD-binding subunit
MNGVRFERPRTLKRALTLLAGGEWTVLAGGTDLLVRVRDGLRPPALLDVTGLGSLRGIRESDGFLLVGALATHADLDASRKVRSLATALAEAAAVMGSPAIRNRGTVGGNLLNASPAGDTVPPLVALEAEVELASACGTRVVPVAALATGPGKSARRPDELLTVVRIPVRPGRRSAFARLGTRKALAIAKVSVAVAARATEDGRLADVRVALGAVGPTVFRATGAESALEGRVPDAATLEAAAEAVKADARPITDLRSTDEYRREMCGVLLRRALASLIEEGA